MSDWVDAELAALRNWWPELEYVEASGVHWVLIKDFPVPPRWDTSTADLAVRIPAGLPGEQPYGFWIKSGIALATGAQVTNYTFPSAILPFTDDNQWGQFSWSYDGWAAPSAPGQPAVMPLFVQSVSRRLGECN
jgi:hypothetical protein